MAASSSDTPVASAAAETPAAGGTPFSAVVLGATGATGKHLVWQLLQHPDCLSVRVLTRRSALPLLGEAASQSPKYQEQLFEDLSGVPVASFSIPNPNDSEGLAPVNVVFCALGTTLKAAGSKERFLAIDHELLLSLAGKAREAGVRAFSYVSASGADPGAWFFYNSVKGRNEQGLAALGFPVLHIMRPALLLTDREDSRPGERFAQCLAPAMDLLLPARYTSIPVSTVARSMIAEHISASASPPATPISRVFENDQIHLSGRP